VRTVCQYHSLANYAVVQLRWKAFSFNFDLIAVTVMSFCVSMPHFTIIGGYMTILKMAAAVAQFYFSSFYIDNFTSVLHFFQVFYEHTKYCHDSSIRGQDITVSILHPPYWNFSSGFDFDHISVIRTIPVLCIKLQNFIYIGPPNAEIWHHIDFSRWLPWGFNTIYGFLLVNATVFGRSKSTSEPKFVDISQFMAEI